MVDAAIIRKFATHESVRDAFKISRIDVNRLYFRPVAKRRDRVVARYDYNNRQHEQVDPLISSGIIGVFVL
jgi:hypothetical protein